MNARTLLKTLKNVPDEILDRSTVYVGNIEVMNVADVVMIEKDAVSIVNSQPQGTRVFGIATQPDV
jgi:hypothetical protein